MDRYSFPRHGSGGCCFVIYRTKSCSVLFVYLCAIGMSSTIEVFHIIYIQGCPYQDTFGIVGGEAIALLQRAGMI